MNATMAGAKGQLGKWYAKNSQVIDRVVRGAFAFLLFVAINSLTGYMKRLDSMAVAAGLALICAFLPTSFVALLGFALLLAHLSALSLPVTGVVALLFLIMYALYFHFTPRHTIFLLLVPMAFWLKVPAVIPVAYGLLGSTALAYPIALGIIMYYTIDYIHANAGSFEASGLAGVITKLSTFLRKLLTNKEMWLYVLAFVVCLWVVSMIRKRDIPHCWKIATVFGALVDLLILAVGAAVLGIKLNLGMLLISHVLAVVVGLVLEYLFFNVDYKHKESLQFEDDDYVYYVSAIPKVKSGAEPQKEVKRLKKESDEKTAANGKKPAEKKDEKKANNKKTETAEKKQGNKKTSGKNKKRNNTGKQNSSKGSGSSKQGGKKKENEKRADQSGKSGQKHKDPNWKDGMTDELLMTQSLRRDLEKEL